MANQEHLDILKQGAEVWNKWRQEHPEIKLDLGGANLRQSNLSGANLSEAFLWGVDFSMANLQSANLSHSGLRGAKFIATNLRGANLSQTNLWDAHFGIRDVGYADLSDANLSHSQLGGVDLSNVNLSRANLNGADLGGANLSNATLDGADFTNSEMAGTALGDRDLRVVKGLETVKHRFPSPLSVNTIYLSGGNIPEVFLQGTGVPNSMIEYLRSLVGKPIDYYSCFISYSSKDQDFAERLHNDLQNKGVRCWFAPEDMKIGDKIRPRIEESIRLYDKLLLVLSEHSIVSNWVSYEVERALNKEPEGIPNVLFPIRLDDAVMTSKAGWADDIRQTRHIGDFCNWKDHDDYQKAFARLLRDLKSESYKR